MTTKYPLVSIIMTVFNKEKHLQSSIDSILNQTYPNIELIIVEDCSTDNSKKLLKTYENKTNVKIIYNDDNIGCYASRNKALKLCKGEFIGFQDADDYSLKKRIKKQIKHIIKNKLLMNSCNIVRSNLLEIKGDEKKNLLEIKKDKSKEHFGYVTLLMHKSIFEKCGEFVERRKGMDMEFGERIFFYELGISFEGKDSWSYYNSQNNKIYAKLEKLLYICPKMDKNNITKSIKDDIYLKNKLWRQDYKKLKI
ncbi:glycosyltransferase family 2 [Catovirus CTV1]|uniref:Glycosyltransferase family 2 n=1 Tax=Catovirus CTV1 TaxID=1977631 RepID=A0A1V0SAH6_9VIRU|nr:glycosyltransferase family 2 [Catovirus CTV1]